MKTDVINNEHCQQCNSAVRTEERTLYSDRYPLKATKVFTVCGCGETEVLDDTERDGEDLIDGLKAYRDVWQYIVKRRNKTKNASKQAVYDSMFAWLTDDIEDAVMRADTDFGVEVQCDTRREVIDRFIDCKDAPDWRKL